MDNSTHRHSDKTSASSTTNRNKLRDRNDIVGRTSLPLPSLAGLEVFSTLEKQETEPIIPVSNREEKITAQLALPSVTEQEVHPPSPPTEAKDARLQPIPLPPTTETRLRAVPARPAQKPGVPPELSSSEQKTASQNTAPLKRIRLRPVMLIGLLCLSLLGAFASIHTYSTNPENSPVPTHQQVSSGQQENNAASGTRNISVGADPSIVIKGYKGNVSIYAGSAGSVIIKTNNNGKNVNSESIQYTQSRDGQGHDFINIATKAIYSSVNYEVSVPSTAQVKVEVDSGSISVDGVSAVTIDTISGSLAIEDVNGPIGVSTENGDITVRNIKGQMAMETRNGSIRGNNVNGQLKAVTQNGDVIVKQATLNGQSVLKTQQGSVRFTGTIDPRGTYAMETHSGDVDLTLPAHAAFQLHATINSGSVSNEFGNNDIGSTPQAQVIINIGSGSVIVKRAI